MTWGGAQARSETAGARGVASIAAATRAVAGVDPGAGDWPAVGSRASMKSGAAGRCAVSRRSALAGERPGAGCNSRVSENDGATGSGGGGIAGAIRTADSNAGRVCGACPVAASPAGGLDWDADGTSGPRLSSNRVLPACGAEARGAELGGADTAALASRVFAGATVEAMLRRSSNMDGGGAAGLAGTAAAISAFGRAFWPDAVVASCPVEAGAVGLGSRNSMTGEGVGAGAAEPVPSGADARCGDTGSAG